MLYLIIGYIIKKAGVGKIIMLIVDDECVVAWALLKFIVNCYQQLKFLILKNLLKSNIKKVKFAFVED